MTFIEFINQNWTYILFGFYAVTLILNIYSAFKYKTSKNLVDFKEVYNLVKEAEEKFPASGTGAQKLAYVISKCSIKTTEVINLVEDILSSPEKK